MVGTCTPGEGAASDAGTPVSEVHPAEDHNTTSKPIERIEPKLVKLRRGISRAVYALNAAKQWQDAKDKERMEKRKRLIRMMNGDHEPDAELDHFMRLVLQEEADAQTPRPWYSVRHTSMIKIRWDMFMMILVFLSGVSIPFSIAYSKVFSKELSRVLDALDTVYLGAFIPDLLLSFFVTFIDENGVENTEFRRTAEQYVKTWFLVDLVAIFPFEEINKGSGALSLFKVMRLLRVGKVLKESNVMMTSGQGIFYRALRILLRKLLAMMAPLVFSIMLLVHWFACLWRYVAWQADPYFGMPEEIKTEVANGDVKATYLFDIYTAIGLLLGQTIDVPSTNAQIVLAIAAMLVGALVLAALFGNVAVLVASFNLSKTRLQKKMDQVNESMKSYGLPPALQKSVRQFYLYSWGRHKAISANAYIHELSPGLRKKISLFLYHDMLVSVPIFSDCSLNVLIELAQAIRAHVFMPHDVIIEEGDIGEAMYIIGDGLVQIRRPDRILVAVLGKGKFFGEMALLSRDLKRQCRVEAYSICDIYELRKVDMQSIFLLHPKLREDMLLVAKKRKKTNEAIQPYQSVRSQSDFFRREKASSLGFRRLHDRISQKSSTGAPSSIKGSACSPEESGPTLREILQKRRSSLARLNLIFKPLRLASLKVEESEALRIGSETSPPKVAARNHSVIASKVHATCHSDEMQCRGGLQLQLSRLNGRRSSARVEPLKASNAVSKTSTRVEWQDEHVCCQGKPCDVGRRTAPRRSSQQGGAPTMRSSLSKTLRSSVNKSCETWRHRFESRMQGKVGIRWSRSSSITNMSAAVPSKSRPSNCGTAVDELSTSSDFGHNKQSESSLRSLAEIMRLLSKAQHEMERVMLEATYSRSCAPSSSDSRGCPDAMKTSKDCPR